MAPMDPASATDPASRTWCGAPIPPEVAVLPHPSALRFVLRLPRPVGVFRAVWCAGLAGSGALLLVLGAPDGIAITIGVALLLVALLVGTRPARLVVTFRPGRAWVTHSSPGTFAVRLHGPEDVRVEVTREDAGWVARLRLLDTTLATTAASPDPDGAAACFLPLANAMRREMGGAPVGAHRAC